MLPDSHRILSRPLRLHWAGWETNTARLQQAGWQLSAEQDFYQDRMRIAMRHQGMNLMAMTTRFDFCFQEAAFDYRYLESVPIQVVQAMGREVFVQEHGTMDWMFKDVDAMPTISHIKVSKLEDLAHFAAPLVRTNEIIIPEESVGSLMDRILELQQPARTERLKEQMRSPEGLVVVPQQKFHAQILSIAA